MMNQSIPYNINPNTGKPYENYNMSIPNNSKEYSNNINSQYNYPQNFNNNIPNQINNIPNNFNQIQNPNELNNIESEQENEINNIKGKPYLNINNENNNNEINNEEKDNISINNNSQNEITQKNNYSFSKSPKGKKRSLSPSNPFYKILYNNSNSYSDSNCWACDIGCSISTTGYSPMTFSPYKNNIKRRDHTPVKPGTVYEEYTRHKKINYN